LRAIDRHSLVQTNRSTKISFEAVLIFNNCRLLSEKTLQKHLFEIKSKKGACFLVSSLLFEQQVLGLDIDILDFQLFCFPIIPSKRQQKRKSAGATARYAHEGLASRPTSSERLSRLRQI